MDPTNPFHGSQNNYIHPNFQNLTLSQTLDFYHEQISGNPRNSGWSSNSTPGTAGSASAQNSQSFEIPSFSTQPDGADDSYEQQSQHTGRGGGGGARGGGGGAARGPKASWSKDDDVLLVSAYLNVTTDPVVNTDQTSTNFWERVGIFYMRWVTQGQAPRDVGSCKCRWQKINASVSKFVGCYADALKHKASGEADPDILQRAYDYYEATRKKKFRMEHAWMLLRELPRWSVDYLQKVDRAKPSSGSGSSKRTRSDVEAETPDGNTPMSAFTEHPIERPMGMKAAKRGGKGKGKKQAQSSSYQEDVELVKQKERESNEKWQKNYEVQMAKEARKAKKLEMWEKTKKMEMLSSLMAQGELPPEGEASKRALMAELARYP